MGQINNPFWERNLQMHKYTKRMFLFSLLCIITAELMSWNVPDGFRVIGHRAVAIELLMALPSAVAGIIDVMTRGWVSNKLASWR